ncbi:MAG: conserved phage C-terminal domain-containing protein [Candidatus Hydrogenedentes bacterium]|nr:conserved phage C-terminal domain-containing protein [Candidatus Hydrogenedentota bacterium]
MNIIQRTKNDSYSVICNTALRDDNLSLQAKGLFAYIMTLPANWVIYRTEIERHSTNGKDSHRSAFNELLEYKYLSFKRMRNKKGQLERAEYTISEIPQTHKTTPADSDELPYDGIPYGGLSNVGSAAPTNYLPQVSTDCNKTPLTPQGGTDGSCAILQDPHTSTVLYKVTLDNLSVTANAVVLKKIKTTKQLPADIQRAVTSVIEYLNAAAGTMYKKTSMSSAKYLLARFREDFTVDDCKKVIDIKTQKWKDDVKMQDYLRPSTLFGTNFESYLNEPFTPTKETKKRMKTHATKKTKKSSKTWDDRQQEYLAAQATQQ